MLRFGVDRLCVAVLILLSAVACGAEREPSGTRRAAGAAQVSCRTRPDGSRWAGEFRQTAEYGRDGQQWLNEVAGVEASDSLVYVYDAPQAKVTALTAELRPVLAFGRKGNGPGEFMTVLDRGLRGLNWRWLSVVGDTVVVFDGGRVHLFARDGRFLEQRFSSLIGTPALSGTGDRVAYSAGSLVTGRGGYDFQMDQPGWERYRWTLTLQGRGAERTLLSLDLAPLPSGSGGTPFLGPEQARPLWDLRDGCVAATNGAGDWLLRGSAAGDGQDTLPGTLPAVRAPRYDHSEFARLGAKYVAPSARRRVAGLIIDPDGYAWLLPWQYSTHVRGGVEIVRVSMQTGVAERDTVPAFPSAFGPPGVYYATTNDRRSGEALVARYDASPAAPPGP